MRFSSGKIDRFAWIAAFVYASAITIWTIASQLFGDGHLLLYLFNTAYLYLFIPAPVLMIAAVFRPDQKLRWASAYIAAVFMLHAGSLFIPLPAPDSGAGEITVMTYNIEKNNFPGKDGLVLESIRAANADVVAVQELNSRMSRKIGERLSPEYPYQLLAPGENAEGMGLISRYPMKKSRLKLPGPWFRAIQSADIAFENKTITLINVHFNRFYPGEPFEPFIHRHRRHAETVSRFAAIRRNPVLLLGDLNATPANDAYRLVARKFTDSWREAGWGFGHTFPGKAKDPKLWMTVSGISTPDWLFRIDYIFHSGEWETRDIRIGPWNGGSDHRPVTARLALREGAGQDRTQD